MSQWKHRIATIPVLGAVAVLAFRAKAPALHLQRQLGAALRWLLMSNETTNFTYDLEPTNTRHLAALIADVAGIEFGVALGYINELERDDTLRQHVQQATRNSPFAYKADKQVMFGKRVCWYAFARATKPRTVFETGVDKGLGACVMTAALMRNAAEGQPGRYYGTDINPDAGYLLTGRYAEFGSVLYGDSIASLQQFDGSIDLFINDSARAAEYELAEYTIIAGKLSAGAIVLSDNSRDRDTLLQFALQTGRHFLFFQERPLAHWYPGSGIGIAFCRPNEQLASTARVASADQQAS